MSFSYPSRSLIALDSLLSAMGSLLSFFLLPLVFLLRIPLTPPLILFNFFSHSLQGLKEWLRAFSNPAAILLVSLAALIFMPFVSSPIISVLLVSPAAPVLLFWSVAIGMSLLLGVLALLIPALALASLFFTGVLLSAIAGALVLLSALSFTGLIAGAVLALILICLIVAGYTPAAVMMGVATGGIAIPPETIALIVLCLGVFVLGVTGGALSGLILGTVLSPLAALITGALAAAILLPLLLLSGSLMLTVLLLVPLIALTSVILPVLLLSALLLAVALLVLTGALFMALPLFLAILLLLTPMGLLALLSILSPELSRIVFPPEIVEITKRIALLPKDAARVINGLLHLPVDIMRAIAVLDAPVNDGGGGDGVQKTYSIVISAVREDPDNPEAGANVINRQFYHAGGALSKYSDETTYLLLPKPEEIDGAIGNYKSIMDEDDVLIVTFVGHGGIGKDPSGEDDEDEDGFIALENRDKTEVENKDKTADYTPYYDDRYVKALKGIKGSVVTIDPTCFSGEFIDDLKENNVEGIHISSANDKGYSYTGAFSEPFFDSLISSGSFETAYQEGLSKDIYANESYWNEIVPKESYYYANETEIMPYKENETRNEYYLRRWPDLDPQYLRAEEPNIVKIGAEDIKLEAKEQPVPQAGLVPRTGSNLIPVPLDGERPPM